MGFPGCCWCLNWWNWVVMRTPCRCRGIPPSTLRPTGESVNFIHRVPSWLRTALRTFACLYPAQNMASQHWAGQRLKSAGGCRPPNRLPITPITLLCSLTGGRPPNTFSLGQPLPFSLLPCSTLTPPLPVSQVDHRLTVPLTARVFGSGAATRLKNAGGAVRAGGSGQV